MSEANPPEPSRESGQPAPKKESWLIAAWPGMGNVAVIAAGYLMQKLNLRPVAELGLYGHFDVQAVEVARGIIAQPRLARSFFFRSKEPLPGLHENIDLTVFIGEAQPAQGAFAFSHALLERAKEWGITKVVTFASMASQMHPSDEPSVHGAATKDDLLEHLREFEVEPMEEGQIGGMNGVLLGAAAERGLQGLCLLGEIPYFAANVPNPKAARAVLEAFSLMTGLEVDLEEMNEHARKVESALLEMYEKIQNETEGEDDDDESDHEEVTSGEASEQTPPVAPAGNGSSMSLDEPTRKRIEGLFTEASRDRSKAVALKSELDKLGVFKQFENRFLDLFKRAE